MKTLNSVNNPLIKAKEVLATFRSNRKAFVKEFGLRKYRNLEARHIRTVERNTILMSWVNEGGNK